ncbi:MAG: PD40 domain-containing protein [Bacteroidales bacterium]|nr:PD40 domain-containing protein [Bacteroidales bacterium]
MKYTILSLFFFCFLAIEIYAQKSEAETNYLDENYDVALEQYLRYYRRDHNDIEVNYRIAVCYIKTDDDKTQALKFLDDVMSKTNFPFDAHFYYAAGLFHKHEFDKAKEKFQFYIDSKEGINELKEQAKNYLMYIETAKKLTSSALDVTFINLGKNINSKRNEMHPLVSHDESLLIITTDKKYSGDYQQYIRNIFYSEPQNNQWQTMRSLGSKINTDENETCVGLAKDGEEILVNYDHLNAYFDIYIIKRKGTTYKEKTDPGVEINTKHREGGASMNSGLDTMFFASDRPGGYGGYDLYYAVKLPNGIFSKPVNLGPSINTVYDENYPYLSHDSRILRFASNDPNSMGGYDVFQCKRKGDGKSMNWSNPENLGYPLNDTYDDKIISFPDNERYAFVSKYREGGFGFLDIYKAIYNDSPRPNFVYTGGIFVGDIAKPTPVLEFDNSISIEVHIQGSENAFGKYLINPNSGNYVISLPPGTYDLIIEGEKIEPYKRTITVSEEYSGENFKQFDIYLKPNGK